MVFSLEMYILDTNLISSFDCHRIIRYVSVNMT